FISTGPGNNTSQGYEMDASTSASFVPFISSITTSVIPSTLTIGGLSPYTTYYIRVGGINFNNVVNYTVLAATRTAAGLAPTSPVISAVYVSTITASWTDVPNTTGYDVEASSTNFNGTGVVYSTVTALTAPTSLTVGTVSPLSANTTYFVRVGALY